MSLALRASNSNLKEMFKWFYFKIKKKKFRIFLFLNLIILNLSNFFFQVHTSFDKFLIIY